MRLLGRQRELTVIAGVLDRGAVSGSVLAIVGEPGIGKSALLAAAADMARETGFRVVSTAGVEAEAQLPFAGLHQLVSPLLRSADRLPAAQREALLSAFGLFDGPRPEPFLIARAVLSLLTMSSDEQPLTVLADDVQWLDPQTQQTLTYVARRSGSGPIAVIGTARTGQAGPFLGAGLPELRVPGVNDIAAQEILLAAAPDLSAADRRRIQDESRGNPLALIELSTTWRRGEAPTTGLQPPTLSARLERAFAGRYEELPPVTRDLLLVAAIDYANDLAEISAAASVLARRPAAAAALEPARLAGLIKVGHGRIEFQHPLVRSAVLQSEPVARRHAANAALAEMLADQPFRRTWHRAQSMVGPDDELADELEGTVAMSLRRGAVTSAISSLERSAQLTRNSPRRGHRLLIAAEHAFGLGRTDLVDHLVREAARTDLTELDWARMQWLREIFHDGVPGDATRVVELCDIAKRCADADDMDLALNLLLGAALRCWWADTGPIARARVVTVAQGMPGVADDRRYVAVLAVAEPVLMGRTVTTLLSRTPADHVEDAGALRLLGMAAHAIGDSVRAADYLDPAETTLREQGQLGLLAHVLSMQVIVRLQLGDWDRATAAAAEGLRLADETGQPIWSARTIGCDAQANALRGHAERALDLAAEAEMAANRQHLNDLLSCIQLARALAWFTQRRYAAAYDACERLFYPTHASYHQRERFDGVMYLAEAAVRADRRADARLIVDELEQVALLTPSPLLHVQLGYARAVLADDADAEGHYLAALAADLTRWPWIRARLALAYCMWLRRAGRASQSRQLLTSAHATLARIGAAFWAAEARTELARIGASDKV